MRIALDACALLGVVLLLAGAAVAKPRTHGGPGRAVPHQAAQDSGRSSHEAGPAAAQNAEPASPRDVVQRESRIEFDERMVQGQTAAGAIYLFQRGEAEFRSMIEVPSSFRERTVNTVFPDSPRP